MELDPTNEDGFILALTDFEVNSTSSNMEIIAAKSMGQTPLADYGFQLNENSTPIVELTFLRWGEDSQSFQLGSIPSRMFPERAHSGTFWFDLSQPDDSLLGSLYGSIVDIQEDP